MRRVAVTITAEGAWEVWAAEVPDDVDDEWIRENFGSLDNKALHDAGADTYTITEIEDM